MMRYIAALFALPRVKFAHRSKFTRMYIWRIRIGLKVSYHLFIYLFIYNNFSTFNILLTTQDTVNRYEKLVHDVITLNEI